MSCFLKKNLVPDLCPLPAQALFLLLPTVNHKPATWAKDLFSWRNRNIWTLKEEEVTGRSKKKTTTPNLDATRPVPAPDTRKVHPWI